MEIDQPEEAIDYYKQSTNFKDNEFTSPLYLFKAGNTALDLGKNSDALVLFERIKNDYNQSEEAKQIDVYIERAKLANK